MTTAREEILARIRAALPAQGTLAPLQEPAYQRKGNLDREARLELLRDRLLDYDADVVDIAAESELPSTIAAALSKAGEKDVVVAAEFPQPRSPPPERSSLFTRAHRAAARSRCCPTITSAWCGVRRSSRWFPRRSRPSAERAQSRSRPSPVHRRPRTLR